MSNDLEKKVEKWLEEILNRFGEDASKGTPATSKYASVMTAYLTKKGQERLQRWLVVFSGLLVLTSVIDVALNIW